MADLFKVCLLGPLQLYRSDTLIANPTSEKIQALLAYLASESEQVHRRDFLAELIWPDQPDGMAKQNLRQALTRLQRSLVPHHGPLPWLQITRHALGIQHTPNLWIDLHHFTALLHETQHHNHERITSCPICCAKLTQAVALYRDDFLLGLMIDSPGFDDWALLKREWLRREVLQALDVLVQFYEAQDDPATAYRFAWRRVEIDPLLEGAHVQVMRNLAHSGRRNEALTQYETLTCLLRDEFGIEPARETATLYEMIRDDKMIGEAPTPPVIPLSRHSLIHLPTQHTPFIGRKAELAQIAERLAHPNCHLLTLVGVGGIGKTRLALEAAHLQARNLVDGVHFVNLAPVTSADLLPLTIVEAVGLSLSEAAETFERQRSELLEQLAELHLLLLLDNAEHLLSGSNADSLLDLVVDIVQTAPHVTLLVTSRQPLELRAEWIFDVEGLTLPALDDIGLAKEEAMLAADAVQLFIQSAQRILPGFVAEGEMQSILEICQRTEGMALAIELAAIWVRQSSCSEIAQRIKTSYDFLATSMRDVPQRHRSLRAVFESSWTLLSQAEQIIYRQLALFSGSFDRGAASAVAGASSADLDNFCAKSLLRLEHGTTHSVRYSLHEALRQFGAEKLAENSLAEMQSRQRHVAYYSGLLQREEPLLNGEEMYHAVTRVHAEIDNIRAAWQRAVALSDIDALERGFRVLVTYYVMSSQVEEGLSAIGGAIACLHQRIKESKSSDHREVATQAEMIAYRGRLFFKLARYQDAIAQCSASVALAEPIEAFQQVALANLYWGISLVSLGALEEATSKFESSRSYAQSIGWRKVEGDAIRSLGIICDIRNELEQASGYYEDSAVICREIGDARGLSASVSNLGDICRRQGALARARQLMEEAIAMNRKLGDRSSEGRTLRFLGDLSADLEEYDQAEAYLAAALAVQRAIKEPQHEADTLLALGKLQARSGRHLEAIACWQQARAIFQRLGETVNLEQVERYLAQLQIA